MTIGRDPRTLLAVLCVITLGAGCATQSKDAGQLPSYSDSASTVVTATVLGVDVTTRTVKLKNADGESFTVKAGPEVRNLGQVRPGDQVKVEYLESIAVEVVKANGSAPDAATATAAARAPAGDKPGAGAAQVTTISATIIAIDRETSRVTLQGPAGNHRVFQVKDPKNLENVAVGDMVYATYTEAVAISVHAAQ